MKPRPYHGLLGIAPTDQQSPEGRPSHKVTTGAKLVPDVCCFPHQSAAGPVPHELGVLSQLQWVFLSTESLIGEWTR